MAQPFNCTNCGTLRPSNAQFCKKCGQPFSIQRVSPMVQSVLQTRPIPKRTPSPTPTPATPAGGSPNMHSGSDTAWQKVLTSIVWAVVTLALLWLTLQRSAPVEVENLPPVYGPSLVASGSPAVPPDVESVYRTVVKDKDGTVLGQFDILLLSKQYVWVSGSTTLIKNLGDITSKGKPPFSAQLSQRILNVPEVIVIGTADEAPIAVRNNPREVQRADDRSTTLYQVVSRMKDENEQAVFKTNFGQWVGAAHEQISYDDQRRIIIVEVRNRSRNLPMNVGLRQALEQYQNAQRIFHHLLNNYSKSRDFEVL